MLCSYRRFIQLRRNKYDAEVIQHWVETSWSGELIDRDLERTVQEEESGHDGPLSIPILGFEDGPGGNEDDAKAIVGAEETWMVKWECGVYIYIYVYIYNLLFLFR